jgi:hypothetical protein
VATHPQRSFYDASLVVFLSRGLDNNSQLVAANRATTERIAQQSNRAIQDLPQLVQRSAEQALQRIEQGAEAAIRKAAVSDVGSKIEAAMAAPVATIGRALQNLEQSSRTADLAASRWQLFTRTFRWQQLAIAVLAGILLGSAGTWYFASQPLKDAADYILRLKRGQKEKTAAPSPGVPKAAPKTRRAQPQQRQPPEAMPPAPAPEAP